MKEALLMSALGLGGVHGCGAAASGDESAGRGDADDGFGAADPGGDEGLGGSAGSAKGGAGGASKTGGANGAEPPPPPEMETELDFEQPRAGARFVFVANPRRDTVAAIDSTTLSIRTIEVGDTPSFLVTVPGQDVALVINAGSRDLSIVRMAATGATVGTVGIVPGVNRIAVAPGGAHAIAWYDARVDKGLGGTGSFQDVSLIRLGPAGDQSFPLTVGFKPSAVHFSNDGAAALIVTEDGVSVVSFAAVTGPTLVPLVPISATPSTAMALDVSVTPDGRFALAREEGKSQITLTNLADKQSAVLDLASPVTDLDLAPDGTWALAVLRDTSTIVKIPLPTGFADAMTLVKTEIAGGAIGQATISPDGKTAVLHTTASKAEQVVVVNLDGALPPAPVRLRKTVRGVAIAPDSRTAILLHDKVAGNANEPNLDVEVRIDRSYGYTVLNLATGFAKLQLTDVDPGPMAITPDSGRAFLLLRNDGADLRVAQRVNLQSFLIDDFVLGSPPLSVAALSSEAKQVFVSQLHPSGRISFINWDSGDVKSVTGFELNGGIVE